MNEHHSDEIRDALHASANDLDLDLAPTADIAGRGRSRRRRRRAAMGGAASLAVVAAIGAIVVISPGDESVETSDSGVPTSTAPVTTQAMTGETTPTTAPVITSPPTLTPAVPAEGAPSTAPADDDSAPEEAQVGAPADEPPPVQGHLAPWGDGFVLISTEFPAQALPTELAPEVRDLFPPEVTELFADGLPDTINEATEMLSEAGLLDEVNAVISEHPEARDAIYSQPSPTPITRAWYTSDGQAWRTVELPTTLPYAEVAVVDGTLTAWSIVDDPDAGMSRRGPSAAHVIATNDLTTWQTTTIDLLGDESLPEYVTAENWIDDVVVLDDRWYALVSGSSFLDYESFIPPDLLAELADAPQGWSIGTSNGGIELTYTDADDELVTEEFTFDELGIDPDTITSVESGSTSTIMSGGFSGDTAVSIETPGAIVPTATLTASDGRLVYAGDAVYTSIDGNDWTRVVDLPDMLNVESSIPAADGAILFVGYDHSDQYGRSVVLRLADGVLDRVDMPDLGTPYSVWGNRSSPAWVVQLEPQQFDRGVTATTAPTSSGSDEIDVPADEWSPDLWVIAHNGTGEWIVRDLEEPTEAVPGVWPSVAAVNGDHLLHATIDGWVLEQP